MIFVEVNVICMRMLVRLLRSSLFIYQGVVDLGHYFVSLTFKLVKYVGAVFYLYLNSSLS